MNFYYGKTLSFYFTPECNLTCKFCYSYRNEFYPQDSTVLHLNQWKELLEEGFTLGYRHLHIFGGEPFLSPLLESLCDHAFHLGYSILIATNGFTLKKEMISWIKKYRIAISFTVNKLSDSWETLTKRKKEWLLLLDKEDVPLTISTCLTQENYTLYYEFIKNTQDKGQWGYYGIYYSPLSKGEDHPELIIPIEKWTNFVRNRPSIANLRIELSALTWNDYQELELFVPLGCQIGTGNMLTIDYLGNVFSCFLFSYNPSHRIGKWKKKGDLRKILPQLLKIKTFSDECEKCDSFLLCKGGCPAYINKENKKDFRCFLTKEKKYIYLCPLVAL